MHILPKPNNESQQKTFENKFKCDLNECDLSFITNYDLKRHVRSIKCDFK